MSGGVVFIGVDGCEKNDFSMVCGDGVEMGWRWGGDGVEIFSF